jgi:hypothetical protein
MSDKENYSVSFIVAVVRFNYEESDISLFQFDVGSALRGGDGGARAEC